MSPAKLVQQWLKEDTKGVIEGPRNHHNEEGHHNHDISVEKTRFRLAELVNFLIRHDKPVPEQLLLSGQCHYSIKEETGSVSQDCGPFPNKLMDSNSIRDTRLQSYILPLSLLVGLSIAASMRPTTAKAAQTRKAT